MENQVASNIQPLSGKVLTEARRQWASHTTAAMTTELHCSIEIVTKKFTTTADGFEIYIKNAGSQKIENFFEKEKLEFLNQSDGKYMILYPERLASEVIDPKDISKILEKQRDKVIRTLTNKNFQYKGKGRAKTGCYTTTRMAEMVKTKTITINTKNETVTRQINVTMTELYKGETGVVVSSNALSVKIKFEDAFFPKTQPKAEAHTEAAVHQPGAVSNEEETTFNHLMVEEAHQKLTLFQRMFAEILSLFVPHLQKALQNILTQNNLKIIKVEEIGTHKQRVTTELTEQDILETVVKPFVHEVSMVQK